MYITEIIIGLISMIVGGGGIWLFTIKSTREKARAEAMKEVQDVYQETITDLREDKRLLKEEKDSLIVEINEMKQSIYSLKKDVEQLKMKNMREKCLNFACKERIIE
ncbi:MAG: hypothetical protein VB046_06900 [Paludibacter sp.]|nr:hypothetical protein [Paludibacter sp.]